MCRLWGGGVVKIDKSSGEQTLLCRANRDIPDNSVIDMTLHNDELWLGMKYYGWCKMKNNTQIVYNKKNTGFHEQQYMSGIDVELLAQTFSTLFYGRAYRDSLTKVLDADLLKCQMLQLYKLIAVK